MIGRDEYIEKKNRENLLGSAVLICETVDNVKESSERDNKIQELIRAKYSLSQELSIFRRKLIGAISEEEFNEYTNYVEECIKQVPEVPESEE